MKYDKAYDQVASPNAGARSVEGKDSFNCDDALGKPGSHKIQTEFDAKEVAGAARKAVNIQIPDSAIPVRDSKHVSDTEV